MTQNNPATLIHIGTPCYGGLVTQGYMQSVIQLMQHAALRSIQLSLGLLGYDALITRSRNTLAAQFLSIPAATHLLFIDADISFDPAVLDRMLAFDVDLVAGMYPLKANNWDRAALARLGSGSEPAATAPLIYVGQPCEGTEREARDGFVTGVYAGTGFMLIRRNVIERMITAYPETRYGSIQAFPAPKVAASSQYALFDCMIDQASGTYLSEDYAFCRRWRAIGGKLWLDTQSSLTHTGPADFIGQPLMRFPQQACAA